MKKETLITMVVFLGVGFLGGYAYNAHRTAVTRQVAAHATITPASNPPANSPSDASLGLPKGHPAVSPGEIVRFFEDAAARNPNNPAPRVKLADFLYDQKQWAEAVSWYLQALRLDPNDVDARTDLATCYFDLGEPDQAIKELNQALAINPHHGPTLFNLIVVSLEGEHDPKAAERAWRRLHAINPNYPHLAELKRALNTALAVQQTASQ
jgi:tetratricopeptide (TPR) repeat protein